VEEIKFIEIYGGKDKEWEGWHNVLLTNGNAEEDICLCGPIDPESTRRFKEALQKK